MSESEGTVDVVFADFYRIEKPGAIRLAWLLTHDEAACDDLVQDAFTAVYRRFSSLDRPAAYLRTTLINGVRQRSRASAREQRRLRIIHASDPLATEGPTGGLADAIAHLPLAHRTAIVLRHWAGLADAEIAEILGVRPATVRSLLHRGTTQLRKEITK